MKVVHIHKDGTMDDLDITIKKGNICKSLCDVSLSQGEDKLKLLYEWPYNNSTILCYGWHNGNAGFENKHDLPPNGSCDFLESDSSEQLLFGDIFIIQRIKNKYADFEISDYGEFYNYMFGGFDDCDSDDDESLDSEEEDEDYEPTKEDEEEAEMAEEEEESYIVDDESELELDNSEY